MKLFIKESREDLESIERFSVSYLESDDPYDEYAEVYDDGGGFDIVKDNETGLYGWESDAMDMSSDIEFNSFEDAYNDAVETHDSGNGILMINGEPVGDFDPEIDSDVNRSTPKGSRYSKKDLSPDGTLVYDGERTIPDSIETLITGIIVQRGVKELPDNSLMDLENLRSIRIPNSVKVIGERALLSCPNLADIKLPEGLTYIGESAFKYCTNLKKLEIPKSVENIGSCAFSNTGITSIRIPGNITVIPWSLFFECKNLTDVFILDGVIEIAADAFSRCENLKSVRIPDSVEVIGEYAFMGCKNVTVYTNSQYVREYCQENGIAVKPDKTNESYTRGYSRRLRNR